MCLLLLGTMALSLSRSKGQRFFYQDDQYLVSVRYGQWHKLQDFIQPYDSDVQRLFSEIGPTINETLDWVCRNISYRYDVGEFWQLAPETIARRYGDCEDSAILTCSLLRNFTDAHVALGNFQGYGHAWCQLAGQILETTYTQALPVPNPEDYCPHALFNEREVIELWPGALGEVFELGRDEGVKLNLMARALEAVA